MEKVILDMTMYVKDEDITYEWKDASVEGVLVAIYDVVEVIKENIKKLGMTAFEDLDLKSICDIALANNEEFKNISLSDKTKRDVSFIELETEDETKSGRKLTNENIDISYNEEVVLSDLFIYLNELLSKVTDRTLDESDEDEVGFKKMVATELLLDVLNNNRL